MRAIITAVLILFLALLSFATINAGLKIEGTVTYVITITVRVTDTTTLTATKTTTTTYTTTVQDFVATETVQEIITTSILETVTKEETIVTTKNVVGESRGVKFKTGSVRLVEIYPRLYKAGDAPPSIVLNFNVEEVPIRVKPFLFMGEKMVTEGAFGEISVVSGDYSLALPVRSGMKPGSYDVVVLVIVRAGEEEAGVIVEKDALVFLGDATGFVEELNLDREPFKGVNALHIVLQPSKLNVITGFEEIYGAYMLASFFSYYGNIPLENAFEYSIDFAEALADRWKGEETIEIMILSERSGECIVLNAGPYNMEEAVGIVGRCPSSIIRYLDKIDEKKSLVICCPVPADMPELVPRKTKQYLLVLSPVDKITSVGYRKVFNLGNNLLLLLETPTAGIRLKAAEDTQVLIQLFTFNRFAVENYVNREFRIGEEAQLQVNALENVIDVKADGEERREVTTPTTVMITPTQIRQETLNPVMMLVIIILAVLAVIAGGVIVIIEYRRFRSHRIGPLPPVDDEARNYIEYLKPTSSLPVSGEEDNRPIPPPKSEVYESEKKIIELIGYLESLEDVYKKGEIPKDYYVERRDEIVKQLKESIMSIRSIVDDEARNYIEYLENLWDAYKKGEVKYDIYIKLEADYLQRLKKKLK